MAKWRHMIGRIGITSLIAAACALMPVTSARAGSPTLTPQPTITAPASIAELARALNNDANLIFEYVYTNITYTPTYGLRKGALGTLLDGQGNDFDQAALLVALLRQAGYTANYEYGTVVLNDPKNMSWRLPTSR